MKRLNDNSDAPKARHGTFPKTSSKKTTKPHSCRPRRNGYSRLRQQKSRTKESLQWIPERVCIWSASGTLTAAELETVRTSRNPTTAMTANNEVQT